MTKDERNKRLKERRMALVLTWTICWMAGLMTGLFVEKMAQQLRRSTEKTAEVVVERAESDAEARERGEIKLHTRAWREGLKRSWSAQSEAEVVVHAAPETEAPETPVPTPEPTAVPTPEPKWIKVLATAYRDSKNAVPTGCINDLPLTEYWSIAAVLGDLPYGTLVEIDGYGVRRVEDTASQRVIDIRLRQAWDRGCATWIDIYMPDAAEVDAFGVRELRLRVIE